jgi:hypothetical protein
MRIGKKRLLIAASGLTAVATAATMVAGVTFGLFSATETSGNNAFTAGTVTVGLDGSTSVTCTITNTVPGDSSTGFGSLSADKQACEYDVKYTGSAPAFIAVDVAVTAATPGSPVAPYGGSAPLPAVGLYDGSATGLQMLVKDGTSTFINGTNYSDQAGAATGLSVNGSGLGSVANLLASTAAVNTNAVKHFSLAWGMPTLATNAYQAASSTITLTFHAVQSGNQTLPGTCAAPKQCNAQGNLAWN